LLALMNSAGIPDSVWTVADYGAMLDHQLDAPVDRDAQSFIPAAGGCAGDAPGLTFRGVLLASTPSLPMLRAVKNFARNLHQQMASGYPEDVALVLYFGALAAADRGGMCRITRLAEQELLEGYAWSLERPWLPADLRGLFRRAADGHARARGRPPD
jgi:hypothetical protein